MELSDCPDEIIHEIIAYLAPHKKRVWSAILVCKRWYRLGFGPVLFHKVLTHGITWNIQKSVLSTKMAMPTICYKAQYSSGEMCWRYRLGHFAWLASTMFKLDQTTSKLYRDEIASMPPYRHLEEDSPIAANGETKRFHYRLYSGFMPWKAFDPDLGHLIQYRHTLDTGHFRWANVENGESAMLTMKTSERLQQAITHQGKNCIYLAALGWSFESLKKRLFQAWNVQLITIMYDGPGYLDETWRLYVIWDWFHRALPVVYVTYLYIYHLWCWKVAFSIKYPRR